MGMAGFAAAALAAAAAASAPAGAATAKAGANDAERQICKSQATVGSRLKRVRVCMTALEWEELKLQEQVGLGRMQINGAPGCNGGRPCAIERGGKDTPW